MKVPMSRPYVDTFMEQKVLEVLRSGKYINGEEVIGFEAELAAYVKVKQGAAVNSCTSAIQLTLMALELKPGDGVLVPSHTMFGTIEPIIHLGAKPIYVEVDESYTMDPQDAAAKVTPSTVGMIVVHIYGQPYNVRALQRVAEQNHLWMIEDCAQAHGACYEDRPVGGMSQAGCFSFFPSKNVTVAGDGGMMVSDDLALVSKVRSLREHGRASKNEHNDIGFNMRLSEIPAAIGRIQLARLEEFIAARNKVAERYDAGLKGLPLTLPSVRENCRHAYHLYVVRTSTECERNELQAHLKHREIETGIHYPIPVHLQNAVITHGVGLPYGSLPRTERYASTILSLPIFPKLTEAEQEHVINSIRAFYGQ